MHTRYVVHMLHLLAAGVTRVPAVAELDDMGRGHRAKPARP